MKTWWKSGTWLIVDSPICVPSFSSSWHPLLPFSPVLLPLSPPFSLTFQPASFPWHAISQKKWVPGRSPGLLPAWFLWTQWKTQKTWTYLNNTELMGKSQIIILSDLTSWPSGSPVPSGTTMLIHTNRSLTNNVRDIQTWKKHPRVPTYQDE